MYKSNTLIFSKDIEQKLFSVCMDRVYRLTDVQQWYSVVSKTEILRDTCGPLSSFGLGGGGGGGVTFRNSGGHRLLTNKRWPYSSGFFYNGGPTAWSVWISDCVSFDGQDAATEILSTATEVLLLEINATREKLLRNTTKYDPEAKHEKYWHFCWKKKQNKNGNNSITVKPVQDSHLWDWL